jgi:predicted RNA-binding Zn ribbon-like protein
MTAAEPDAFFGPVWPRPRDGLEVAIAFLNTWDLLARPPEMLRGPDALRRFLAWVGRPAGPELTELTERDVAKAIAARDRLREAFDADSQDTAVGLLNGQLLAVGGVPQLTREDDHWRAHYVTRRGGPLEGLVAEAAGGLLAAIQEGFWERLGRCSADPCRCAYVDRTKNRARRFCSTLCTDRAMQAASRRRKRARVDTKTGRG